MQKGVSRKKMRRRMTKGKRRSTLVTSVSQMKRSESERERNLGEKAGVSQVKTGTSKHSKVPWKMMSFVSIVIASHTHPFPPFLLFC
jgi:hypothetical protein